MKSNASMDAGQEQIFEQMLSDLKQSAPRIIEQGARNFREIFESVLRELFEDSRVVQRALDQGRFVLDHVPVTLQLSDDQNFLKIWSCLGRPQALEQAEVWRQLLEANFSERYPGLTFAIETGSGQLIGIASAPVLMISDRTPLLQMLDQVVLAAQELSAELHLTGAVESVT